MCRAVLGHPESVRPRRPRHTAGPTARHGCAGCGVALGTLVPHRPPHALRGQPLRVGVAAGALWRAAGLRAQPVAIPGVHQRRHHRHYGRQRVPAHLTQLLCRRRRHGPASGPMSGPAPTGQARRVRARVCAAAQGRGCPPRRVVCAIAHALRRGEDQRGRILARRTAERRTVRRHPAMRLHRGRGGQLRVPRPHAHQ